MLNLLNQEIPVDAWVTLNVRLHEPTTQARRFKVVRPDPRRNRSQKKAGRFNIFVTTLCYG